MNNDFNAQKEILNQEQELKIEKNLVWVQTVNKAEAIWFSKLFSNDLYLLDDPHIGLFLNPTQWNKDNPLSYIEFQQRGPTTRYSYFFHYSYKESWKFYLRKLILNRIYVQFRDLSKGIIIRETDSGPAADILSECFPNSKIIILLRDGRDVIDSWIDHRQQVGRSIQFGGRWVSSNDRIELISCFGKLWVYLTEVLIKASKNHSKELCYVVKYEDIKKNPLDELQKIFDFLGIRFNKNLLKKKIERDNIPKTSRKFNENEKTIMNEIMGKMLAKVGYR